MDNLSQDKLEIDKDLEEKSEDISETKIEEHKVDGEKVENEENEEKKTFQQGSENQADLKENFDNFVSKNNLLEYIKGAISLTFVLCLLYQIYKFISLGSSKGFGTDSGLEDFLSGFGKLYSKIEDIKTIAKIRNFTNFLIILSIILVVIIFYKTVIFEKRKDFLKFPTNISFFTGVVTVIIVNITIKEFFNSLKASLFYVNIIVSLISIIAFSLTVYMIYLIAFKNQDAYNVSDSITNTANSTINSGITEADKVLKKVKSADYSIISNNFKKYKKYIISAIVALVIVVGGIVGYNTVTNMLKPDAVVSLADMNITLNISGYDGYGIAKVDVMGSPIIREVKDQKKMGKINQALVYKVELSKDKGIKNGDEITATLKFEDTKGLNIKFDKTELTVSAKANDLREFVREFKDVEKHLDRMDEEAKKSIGNSYRYNDVKDLKVEILSIYDLPFTEEQINSAVNAKESLDEHYKLVIVYKITGSQKEFLSEETKAFEDYKYYEFYHFKKRDDALTYSTLERAYLNNTKLNELENELKVDGYKKVK